MTEPVWGDRAATEAGRLYTEGTLADAIRRWGTGFTLRTVILEVEHQARAEATAAAEQRLRATLTRDVVALQRRVPSHPGDLVTRSEVLRLLDSDTPPSASPRQGEPVDLDVERLARALGAWWAGIEADAKRMGGDLRGVTFDRPNAAAAIIARHYAGLSTDPAEPVTPDKEGNG